MLQGILWKKRLPFIAATAFAIIAFGHVTMPRAAAAPLGLTFTVNSKGDGGDINPGDGICQTSGGKCSFRAALQESNMHSGADAIHFHIGTGSKSIKPGSSLPTITDPVTIDATTQPGCANYPCIILNGVNTGPAGFGLYVSAGTTTISGLVINRFANQGIFLKTNGGNTIKGNYIGTDVNGTTAFGNYIGIEITDSSGTNTIGGTTAGARNVISGNGTGVWITGTGTNGNKVRGNYIGTDATGKKALANDSEGVLIISHASNNTIGGTAKGAGNIIAHNKTIGVAIGYSASETLSGNAILGNSIHDNAMLGIDLGYDGVTMNDTGDGDPGANNLQNFPVITSANHSTSTIHASLNSTANTQFTVEFFSGSKCDSSGYGEGSIFLGRTTVTTDGSGNVNITFVTTTAFTSGSQIRATATDPNNNTSEFSKCKQAT